MSLFCQQRLQFGYYIDTPVSTRVLRFSFISLYSISLAATVSATQMISGRGEGARIR